MLEDFLNIEVLLTPESYHRINSMSEKERKNLLEKIKEFKNINDTFILLDDFFLNIFLNHNLEDIIKTYQKCNFLKYYVGNGVDDGEVEILEGSIGEVLDSSSSSTTEIVNNTVSNVIETNNNSITVEYTSTEVIDKTHDTLLKMEEERKKRISEIRSIRNSINRRINYVAKDIESKIKVYKEWDITGKSTCEGTIEDFIKYFRDRYNRIKGMIERKVKRKAYPLEKLYKMKGKSDVFIVGIVSDISTTKKGHRKVEIEDEKTSISVILMKDKIARGELPDDILLDEVVGFVGYVSNSGDIFFANECIRPDITPRTPKSIDEKIYTAFLSDIHVGSKEFLEKTFRRFIELLNGKISRGIEEKIVSRLKYISIAGDLIDGVGVYPGQEEDLYEIDVMAQYAEIATYLEEIPEHVHIIISPGNHDAVRPAEPQPALPKKVLKLFDSLDNVTFIGNPSYVNVHGLDFLIYHGRSFDDIVGQVPSAKYTDPPTIMRELLKRRHLCPTYGGRCPIAPEHMDYLVIHKEPDVFHAGHIHINGYGTYKGTVMVNSGTFQEQTEFQKKMGIHPTPGRVPILDMSRMGDVYIEWDNGKITIG
ncbi:DNA-directed DNA polymerase II small subunit [Methanothermococcus sp. SCGC AD-155-N22]|nr:DNA-directed DNA polymerase II small subunit [Methanothermococcus sp. SCGC AD-155-N22]MBW9220420.1 DNA-directed DNA polymerase II small subunit [Methanothermococcus sp. SCGC AD-155-N22]